ncbi:alpha/beta hydrolase fold domain-containing protein [Nocardiopsis changdeensis]|uniref:alpha/beta hydrolase fold domain-containing protein n=1 Tax=Nocardiopsis changdeensis TaxID=2831969 RepID=UPI003F494E8A
MRRGPRARILAALTDGLDVHDDTVPGEHGDVPVRRYGRTGGRAAAHLVWVHSGAFSHGGLDRLESHAVAATLARRGVGATAVDYRRVPAWSRFRDAPPGPLPGVRFPVPPDDVASVLGDVLRDRPGVWLGGAGAGACLGAAAAARAAARGGSLPAYGTFHAHLPPIPSHVRARVRGRHGSMRFRPGNVRRTNHNYTGSAAAMANPFAFPGGQGHRGPPPALMVDADRDTLRASGGAFAAEPDHTGIPVEHHLGPGSAHGFPDRPNTPHFAQGAALIADRLTAPRKGR